MVQRHYAKQRHYWMIAACGLLIGTSALQGCKDDDVLTGQPDWLGNSIYERLEEDGNVKQAIAIYRRLLSQPEWKKTAESSWAHQALERHGVATGGAVVNEVR